MPRIAGRFRPYAGTENIWRYTVTPTAGYAHTPTVTLWAGCPYTPIWNWGDGSAPESGVTMTHTYAVAGTYTVTVEMPALNWWLATINVNTDKVSGDFLRTLLPMTRLTSIIAHTNALINSNCGAFNISVWPLLGTFYVSSTAVSGNISGWVLPAGLVNFYVALTAVSGNISGWVLPAGLTDFRVNSIAVSGNISGWVLPAGLVTFFVYSTAVSGDISGWVLPAGLVNFYVDLTAVSGNISGWVLPAGLVTFYVDSTAVSGAPLFTSAVPLASFYYQNCALPAATVDLILSRMYARRASFNAATKTANLGGTNEDPGGVYQAQVPPTSGLECKYELVNDSASEGFGKWAITT